MIRTTLVTLALLGGALGAQAPASAPGPGPQGRPCPCPGGPEGLGHPGPGPIGQPGPRGLDHPGPGLPLKALGLTPDQNKAFRAILDKHRATDQARRKTAEQCEEALHTALEDPATSESQLRALHLAAAEAHFQSLLEHRSLLLELHALLTPDQQAKAKRIRDNQGRERQAHRALAEDLGGPEGAGDF
jgi:Spy/CpxP family protein refolding chaperone